MVVREMPHAAKCVCGYFPETVIVHKVDGWEYLTKCRQCQIVYVNGPSKSIEHSLATWNSYLREAVRMIVQRSIQTDPDLRESIAKMCL